MATRRRSPRPRRLPTLTPEIVADDEQLAEVTDEVMLRDRELRRISKRIVLAQQQLQRVLGDEWRVYLALEEVVNERLERLCVVVTRWAFEEGLRRRP